jgi:tetratricopeptide (TPR) repeat protein
VFVAAAPARWTHSGSIDVNATMSRLSPIAPIFLLVLLLPASAPAQGDREEDFERLFTRALELHQAGDILGAIDTYKAALTIAPGRPDALSNLGAAYVRLGQYDDAVAQYEEALKADPDGTPIRLNLALAYYKSARPSDAIPHLRRVVASDPEARNAYLILADCYLQTGRDEEAVSLLKPREQMFGQDLAFAYVLGTALLHLQRESEAQAYVDRIFGAGNSAESHLLMGIAHLARQDFHSARTELEQSVKLNPQLLTANSMHGRALLALGAEEAAERAFRRELTLNVNDFHANLQLGHLRARAQRFPEAATYLERAVAIRPADLAARKLLADLRLQTGRTEDAVAVYEALVTEAPEFVEAHVQLATAYHRLKRTTDAQRHREIVDRLNAEAQARQK